MIARYIFFRTDIMSSLNEDELQWDTSEPSSSVLLSLSESVILSPFSCCKDRSSSSLGSPDPLPWVTPLPVVCSANQYKFPTSVCSSTCFKGMGKCALLDVYQCSHSIAYSLFPQAAHWLFTDMFLKDHPQTTISAQNYLRNLLFIFFLQSFNYIVYLL